MIVHRGGHEEEAEQSVVCYKTVHNTSVYSHDTNKREDVGKLNGCDGRHYTSPGSAARISVHKA